MIVLLRGSFPGGALLTGVALWGCVPTAPFDLPEPPTLTTPELTAVTFACEPLEERWVLSAALSSWTGGAALWMSADAAYVEVHPLISAEATPDGSADALRLTLPIVADWRDAAPGGSTAFLCSDAPAALLWWTDADSAPAGCAELTDATLRWESLAEPPACP